MCACVCVARAPNCLIRIDRTDNGRVRSRPARVVDESGTASDCPFENLIDSQSLLAQGFCEVVEEVEGRETDKSEIGRVGNPVAITNSAYATSDTSTVLCKSPFGFATVAYKTNNRDLRVLHFYIGGKPADEHVYVPLCENPFETSVTRSSLYITLCLLLSPHCHTQTKTHDLRVLATCYPNVDSWSLCPRRTTSQNLMLDAQRLAGETSG